MIISRQLKAGMDLARGKEILHIESVGKVGRSCIAFVTGPKGKKEKLSITDMWNQKISIVIEKSAEKPKSKSIPEKAKPLSKKEVKSFRRHEVKRAGGISVTYYDKNDEVVHSYWSRSK